MPMMLTGVGREGVTSQFSFTSTGATFASAANIANAPFEAMWVIEGVDYPGVSRPSTALASTKTISFGINPASSLVKIDLSNSTLVGTLPSLNAFTALSLFFVNGNIGLTGGIPAIGNCPALNSFYVSDCSFSGPLPSLSASIALVDFRADNMPGLSGAIPSFGATALQNFSAQWGTITTVDPAFSVPASLVTARFAGNSINQAGIDKILSAFVAGGVNNGTLRLEGGSNATPSAAGLVDLATLTGRGWTVTNN